MSRPGPAPEPGPAPAIGPGAADSPVSSQVWDGRAASQVLLVEDDPGDATAVEELLAGSGISADPRWARSLEAATAALDRALPRCDLLDDVAVPHPGWRAGG